MTVLRGNAHHTLTAPPRLTARPITLAVAALLVTVILAVAIALATSGGSDQPGSDTSVSVTPSAPTAGDIQRSQPPGVNGPGTRP